MQLCPLCNKPVKGQEFPTAKVFHMDCLMENTRHIREDLQRRTKELEERKPNG